MARDGEGLVVGLVPDVGAPAAVGPRLRVHGFIGEDGEGRHAVFVVVLVLVVTPQHAQVGLELVQRASGDAEAVDQVLAVRVGVALAVVRAPLLAHGRRPVVDVAQPVRQRRVLQAHLDAAGHVALKPESRVVRDAQAEYLSHVPSPFSRGPFRSS